MTRNRTGVVAGADTHSLTHHVAVLDAATGAVLADRQFPATQRGYRLTLDFVAGFGQIERFGIEGTNSYGAGLARYLSHQGVEVREVVRPNRAHRRLRGKSDPLDAIQAAKVTLSCDDLPTPKSGDGPIESIRVLFRTRDSAVRARAVVLRQITMILVSAPICLRERFATVQGPRLLEALRRTRPADVMTGPEAATLHGLRSLARRHRDLSTEIDELTDHLRLLIEHTAPALLAAHGVGVVTAAQLLITAGDNPQRISSEAAFAAMCGVSPIPASSGKTNRNRLNRGGDRGANCALHQIALVRMSCDERTKNYIAKKHTEGKSTKEALRCLKRAIAREVYKILINPPEIPRVDDLRPTRLARGITLQQAAEHFGVWPSHISEIERSKRRDDTLAHRYREWLNAA